MLAIRVVCALLLVSQVLAGYPYPNVVCRCQKSFRDRPNPTYPSLSECKIPNANDFLSSFVENDKTWCPTHEFGQGNWYATPKCSGSTPCQQTLYSTNKKWICKMITPKCCTDVPDVDGSVYGPYNCANDMKPQQNGANCPIKCQSGYKLAGGPAKCVNGNWTNLPTCASAKCAGTPKCTNSGSGTKCVMGSGCAANSVPGTKCTFSCTNGGVASGSIECVNGKWGSGNCHKKSPNNCKKGPAAPFPANGHYNCKNVRNGGTCPLRCKYGFKPAGVAPKCSNGRWVQPSNTKSHAHCACKKFEKIQPNTPLACIFGGFSGIDRVDFLVDTSGSMRVRFKVGKVYYTRMAYVQKALVAAIKSLAPTQSFNILRFSSSASQWKNGVTKVSAANKNAAIAYVNKFRASGGTNMVAGVNLAKRDKNVQGVFLLTDGVPNGGYAKVHKAIRGWKNGQGQLVKVYPVAFQAPAVSQREMRKIAGYTGGKYHHVV